MIHSNIVIRGTGICAERLIRQMNALDKEWLSCILCFVDHDPRVHGTIFHDKPVMSDDNIDWHERNFLYIIALGDGERVVKELQSDKNLVYGNDIITYQDYLSRMYRKYLKGTELVTSLLAWECSDEGWDGLHNLCRTHDVVDVLTCLYQIYQGNIGKVMPIIEHNVIPAPEHRNIKTVGLYVYAYGGGGAERVVSLLIPRFTSIGYRVILITQIQNELNEYSLLNDVQRITLSNQMKDEPEKYFRQWQDIFSSYHLDALCLHLPYEGEVFFFTALLAKLCGLRVIGENHTSCINFVRQRGGLRGHDRMYRILDGLVVLSRMDELFWSVFGCRTRYIS